MRAIIGIILLLINMILVAAIILICFCLLHLLPGKALRHRGFAWLQRWPVWWMEVNYWILQISTHKKWQIEGAPSLNPQSWYLLICNHQSWMDILVLGIVFRRQLPILKFFMKQELLWSLPVAGWACYVLGYPFMARHSHEQIRKNPQLKTRDIETARRACNKFKEFPTAVVNFVEGTRFTPEKRDAQQSPYRHLLKPRATGVAVVLKELHPQLSGIINVTLHYQPENLSLWNFLSGKIEKIHLQYELLPITPDLIGDPYEDRLFRRYFQQWLNALWQQKDQQLDRLNPP